MNFTSQICTTKIQSEYLLTLGLKQETADMVIRPDNTLIVINENSFIYHNLEKAIQEGYYPAWSLHRLIEMIPSFIDIGEHNYMFSIIQGKLFSYGSDIAGNAFLYGKGSVYDSAIYTVEWLIKGGYFNKEYLK